MKRGVASLRDVQKQAGIEHVKTIARQIISAKDYRNISMDEVARAAGVSRTTLYAYFPSKGELLFSFLEDDMADQILEYQNLSRLDVVDEDSVRDWLRSFRRCYDRHREVIPLFAEAFRYKPELSNRIGLHREKAITILGKRFAAFDLAQCETEQQSRKRARAHLMIVMIEQVATLFSIDDISPELDDGISLIGSMLLDFLKTGKLSV